MKHVIRKTIKGFFKDLFDFKDGEDLSFFLLASCGPLFLPLLCLHFYASVGQYQVGSLGVQTFGILVAVYLILAFFLIPLTGLFFTLCRDSLRKVVTREVVQACCDGMFIYRQSGKKAAIIKRLYSESNMVQDLFETNPQAFADLWLYKQESSPAWIEHNFLLYLRLADEKGKSQILHFLVWQSFIPPLTLEKLVYNEELKSLIEKRLEKEHLEKNWNPQAACQRGRRTRCE